MRINTNIIALTANRFHGSGIDADWTVTETDSLTWEVSNDFHCMDENGYYCGWLPFTIILDSEGRVDEVEIAEEDEETFGDDIDVEGLKEYLADGWNAMLDSTVEGLSDDPDSCDIWEDDDITVETDPDFDTCYVKAVDRLPTPEPDFESTEECLQAMLTENTGRHMLDSGGAYGRHWERNQGVDFSKTPTGHIEFHRPDDWYVIVSIYHFLVNNLDYCGELDAEFQRFATSTEYADEPWGSCVHDWVWRRFGHKEDAATGPYGENPMTKDDPTWGGYTYNEENSLSQDFIWAQWTVDGETFIAIQIHGGCDARGGFTRPRIFSDSGNSELGWLDWNRVGMGCDKCRCHAYGDGDGWEWYDEDGHSLDVTVAGDGEDDDRDEEDNAPDPADAPRLKGKKCAVIFDAVTERCTEEVYTIERVYPARGGLWVDLDRLVETGVHTASMTVTLDQVRLLEGELSQDEDGHGIARWDDEAKTLRCPCCESGHMSAGPF